MAVIVAVIISLSVWHFQPSLIFAGKAAAYQSKAPVSEVLKHFCRNLQLYCNKLECLSLVDTPAPVECYYKTFSIQFTVLCIKLDRFNK
jgi:hypothetical protein